MEQIGSAVTDLVSKMQSSPERTASIVPETPTITEQREEETRRIAIRDRWIHDLRDAAIAVFGDKPFGYDANQIQKRNILGQLQSTVIAGLPGRGKSMAMAWVVDRVIEKAVQQTYEDHNMSSLHQSPFLFVSGSALWDMFHAGNAPNPRIASVFIDDWGMEYREPFAISRADEWFRLREATSGVRTWMTTNMSREQFLNQQGLERIVSRIQGMCDWVEFIGADRRKSWKR